MVNIGSTGFENIAVLFHDDRVRKKCAILTDLDTSILTLPPKDDDESVEIKGCRNSEISGLNRQKKLAVFIKGNAWIDVFYATYTFEVDFVMENNSYEVGLAITDEYKTQKALDDIAEKLKSKKVAIAGKEILRLAEKFGKGWFAIMVAEKVTHLTGVPSYIIEALAFALKQSTWQFLTPMIRYRLKELTKSTLLDDKTDYAKLLTEFNAIPDQAKALTFFTAQLPNDPITSLIKQLTDA